MYPKLENRLAARLDQSKSKPFVCENCDIVNTEVRLLEAQLQSGDIGHRPGSVHGDIATADTALNSNPYMETEA